MMDSSTYHTACAEAFGEALDAATRAPDDRAAIYELATQSVLNAWAVDANAVERARTLVDGSPPLAVLASADQGALLAQLEHALTIAEDAPGHLFFAVSEVDAFICAAEALGLPDASRSLLEQAQLLCRLHIEQTAEISHAAANLLAEGRLAEGGQRLGLWALVAEAKDLWEAPVEGRFKPSVLDDVFARQSGANVIVFPFSRVDAAPRQAFAMAAATEAIEANGALLAEGPDGCWQLYIARPNQSLELQLFVVPEHGPLPFSVRCDGETLHVVQVEEGLASVVLEGTEAVLEVQVGDAVFTCRYAEPQ